MLCRLHKEFSGREPAALTKGLQAGLRARRWNCFRCIRLPVLRQWPDIPMNTASRLTVAGAASGFHRFPVRSSLRQERTGTRGVPDT